MNSAIELPLHPEFLHSFGETKRGFWIPARAGYCQLGRNDVQKIPLTHKKTVLHITAP